ncbi:B-cell receptor-associated protein 31-like-domain-containing protein [Zopfochytrium polystomum]|nr:B-cell receptor-associated protein 31-like-domain-containing protein [Zopfochytrium polystomum]
MLVTELVLYLISLIPLNFIPLRSRKAAVHAFSKGLANDTVKWLTRLLLLIVGGVFVDTISRLVRLDSSLQKHGHDHSHGLTESTLEDLQYKTKLFYSQRNMYLSVMSLFMVLVLFRRMKDVYLILQLQESEESSKTTIKALKEQVGVLIASAADKGVGDKKTANGKPGDKFEEGGSPPEKLADPIEQGGMRKRGAKSN